MRCVHQHHAGDRAGESELVEHARCSRRPAGSGSPGQQEREQDQTTPAQLHASERIARGNATARLTITVRIAIQTLVPRTPRRLEG